MNAVLVSTNVLFITVIAAFFLKEKLTGLKLFYVLLATAGAVFVIFNTGFSFRGEGDFIGSLFSILAALTFSVYTILGKKVLERNDPLLVTSLSLLSGAVLLSLLTGLTTGFGTFLTLPLSAWLLIVLLGLGMIGIAYPIWFFCLKRVKASHISIFIYMVPVFAGILSYFILGETFSWRFYTGTALILLGIILIGRMDRKPA